MKRKHTSDERKIERNSHYDEMETSLLIMQELHLSEMYARNTG